MNRALSGLLLLTLLSVELRAEETLVGRWFSRQDGRLEVVLTLDPDGKASWQETRLLVLFAETLEGECVARTSREEQKPVLGAYTIQDGEITFDWDNPPESSELLPEDRTAWPYSLEDRQLTITLSGRQLSWQKANP